MKMLEKYYDKLMGGIPAGTDVPAIDITGAARWFAEESEQDYWDFSEDFPAVVPPFPVTWLEFVAPKFLNREGRKEVLPREFTAMGCMATSVDIKDGYEQEVIAQDGIRMLIEDEARRNGQYCSNLNTNEERNRRIAKALSEGHEAKWIAGYTIYAEICQQVHSLYTLVGYLDKTGRIIPNLHMFTGRKQFLAQLGQRIGAETFPFLFALSLMHAKNVSLENIPIPPAVAKKRQKRNKKIIQFKTLHIQPMRQAARQSAAAGQASAKRAMHLCRGHFKDFREGPGLFGKYKGLYWWDMHVRGDATAGKVIKDYSVHAPS